MSFLMKKRVYLDHAAATPMRREVRQAMECYFSNEFANPSAIYEEGRRTRAALEDARRRVARAVHAGARDIVFTSGGTESDNLAILGALEKAKNIIPHPHIIVALHEHPALLEAAREAERRGAEITIVPVSEMISHIRENTVLLSLSLVSGETGEIAPVSRIGRAVREARKKHLSEYPYLHVDASQSALTEDLNVDTLQADLLGLDGGKIYGPKGAGCLVVRPWAHLAAQMLGGGQERGLRAGTENVPSIVGFATALELAQEERQSTAKRLKELRDLFVVTLGEQIPQAVVNGAHQAPHIISVTIPDKLHEYLAIALAERGVCVSAGSSCSSGKREDESSAVRFSLGRETSRGDVRRAVRALRESLI